MKRCGGWVEWEDAENACNAIREFDEFIEKHNQALKVFCKHCKHFDVFMRCMHPNNLVDSWEMPDASTILEPSERNKHNDCSLFKRKGE